MLIAARSSKMSSVEAWCLGEMISTSHDLTSERVGLTVLDSLTSFLEDGLPGLGHVVNNHG